MNGTGNGGLGWRWWVRLGVVLTVSVAAVLMILLGAVRFLNQAQQEHDRAECLRAQLQAEAQGNARMGAVVLNPRNDQPTRQAAFVKWSEEQGQIADRIGRC